MSAFDRPIDQTDVVPDVRRGMLLMVAQLWWASHQLKDDDVARASDRPATVS